MTFSIPYLTNYQSQLVQETALWSTIGAVWTTVSEKDPVIGLFSGAVTVLVLDMSRSGWLHNKLQSNHQAAIALLISLISVPYFLCRAVGSTCTFEISFKSTISIFALRAIQFIFYRATVQEATTTRVYR